MLKKIIMTILSIFLLFIGLIGYKSYKAVTRQVSPIKQTLYYNKQVECIAKHNAKLIHLKTKDDVNLKALFIENPNAKRMFVVLHGYRQAKESYTVLCDLLENATLLLIDMRAHGESCGNLISYGFFEAYDAQAGFDYLKKYNNTLPIIGLGFSMGAVALAKSINNGVQFDALILDCAFSNLKIQVDRLFSRFTGLPAQCNLIARAFYRAVTGTHTCELDVGELLKGTTVPIFIIHCLNDTTTPSEDSQHIFHSLYDTNARVKLWISPEGKHVGLVRTHPLKYKQKLDDFFKSVTL